MDPSKQYDPSKRCKPGKYIQALKLTLKCKVELDERGAMS